MTQLRANRRGKEDLMEKILPLIESVTTSREMVPSDLTRGYDGFVFPGPLSQSEVKCVYCCVHLGVLQQAAGCQLSYCCSLHVA